MKYCFKSLTIFCVFIVLLSNASIAQIAAITEEGKEVLLFEDGTWKYSKSSDTLKKDSLIINNVVFKKSKTATFLVKSNKMNVGFYINPLKFKFEKSDLIPAAEYLITSKSKEIYGMLVTERISVPLQDFKSIILSQIKLKVDEISMLSEEYRYVNGEKIICLSYKVKYKGMSFIYLNYLYVNENGNCQLATWTGSNLYKEYKKEMEELLNGLVEIKK